MAKLTADQMAAKWAKNFGASGELWLAQINRTAKNPAQLAVAQQEVMQNNWNQMVNSGEWARRMQLVTPAAWKAACAEKGKAAIMGAAKVGQEKVERAERRIGPMRDQIIAGLPARGDINANIERSAEFQRRMHALRIGLGIIGGQF